MEQSEEEVKTSVCITGKIKAVKITLQYWHLKFPKAVFITEENIMHFFLSNQNIRESGVKEAL